MVEPGREREGIIFERVPKTGHQRKLLVIGKVERRHNRVIWVLRSDRAMVPETDIWRAANLLIRRHGANAELEAAKRADLMLDRGDDGGRLLWMRIRRAVEDLQALRPRSWRRTSTAPE